MKITIPEIPPKSAVAVQLFLVFLSLLFTFSLWDLKETPSATVFSIISLYFIARAVSVLWVRRLALDKDPRIVIDPSAN